MRQLKLILVALPLAVSMLGCGNSKPEAAKLNELTPEQRADQEALLKEADAAERVQRKNKPKEKSADELAEESERNRRR